MYSKAPESIEEAILIIDGGSFEHITVAITSNSSSIIIRLLVPFLKRMNLFWNAITHALSSSIIKTSVFLKMRDLKLYKNNFPNVID